MSAAFDYAGVQFEKGESADTGAGPEEPGAGDATDTGSGPKPGQPVGSPDSQREDVLADGGTSDTKEVISGGDIENSMFEVPSRYEVVSVPAPSRREETHQALRQWEGVVEVVEGDEFVARLTALDDPAVEDEIVTVETARVAEDDRSLIEPGAVFYWNIGETRTVDGQLLNYSEIRFRRLPKATKRDIKRAAEEGAELKAKLFGGESD